MHEPEVHLTRHFDDAAMDVAKAVEAAVLQEFGSFNHCIAASQATKRLLERLGVEARTEPVEVLVFDHEQMESLMSTAQATIDRSIGRVTDEHPDVIGSAWNGHMVVIAEGLLIDPTAAQITATEGEYIGPLVYRPNSTVAREGAFPSAAPLHDLPTSKGGITYRFTPSNRAFQRFTDWSDEDLHDRLANRAMDRLVDEGIAQVGPPPPVPPARRPAVTVVAPKDALLREVASSVETACRSRFGDNLRKCIAASMATVELLRRMGIDARTEAVELIGYEGSSWDGQQLQHLGSVTGSTGVVTPELPEIIGDTWNGHMVVIAHDTLIDPTAAQLAISNGGDTGSIVTNVPEGFFGSGDRHVVQIHDPRTVLDALSYRRTPGNRGFERTLTWHDLPLHQELANAAMADLMARGIVAEALPVVTEARTRTRTVRRTSADPTKVVGPEPRPGAEPPSGSDHSARTRPSMHARRPQQRGLTP